MDPLICVAASRLWFDGHFRQQRARQQELQRTLAPEWAYRQAWSSNDERTAALTGFLHRYNNIGRTPR